MDDYQRFRITARGLVVQNQKLLCVSDDGENWYSPGGRLECGESLPSCVEREVYEETGFVVKAGPLRYVLECLDKRDAVHKLHFYFETEIIVPNHNKEWKDSGGTVQFYRFFSLEEIKENKKILPPFLAKGGWCSFPKQNEENVDIYQGTVKMKGFELIVE